MHWTTSRSRYLPTVAEAQYKEAGGQRGRDIRVVSEYFFNTYRCGMRPSLRTLVSLACAEWPEIRQPGCGIYAIIKAAAKKIEPVRDQVPQRDRLAYVRACFRRRTGEKVKMVHPRRRDADTISAQDLQEQERTL